MSNHAAELSAPLGYGHLEINLDARQLLRHGQPIRLTRTEWALLDLLARNAGHVLTHCFLLRSVWGDTYDESHEYLHTYINRLRRKLEEDPRQPRYLLTEPGLGYRLMPALPTPPSAGVPPRSSICRPPVRLCLGESRRSRIW
jgi:two-component system KDP operon response regulator KdpE